MSFLYVFISGILIGMAMIAPGLSGCVLAVILGIYDKMIESLKFLFKDFKKNFIFLFVLSLGVMIGAIFFSRTLIYFYTNYEVFTKFLFIGLIIGGIPYLYKDILKKNKKLNIYLVIITIIFSLILYYLSKNSLTFIINNNKTKFWMFFSGFIYSVGKVVPGISGSFLLILLGLYEYMLSIFANPFIITIKDIIYLSPFILGFIMGVILFVNIINYLLEKKFGTTYSIIIGFVIGSLPAIIPNINNIFETLEGIIFIIIGFLLSNKLIK